MWEKEIEDGLERIKDEREKAYAMKYYRNNRKKGVSEEMARCIAHKKRQEGAFDIKNHVVVKHGHGYILMDTAEFMALPKTKQDKILKLGGR